MMTTDNIYKNEVPEIPVEPPKPKRHRRTKAQMKYARKKLAAMKSKRKTYKMFGPKDAIDQFRNDAPGIEGKTLVEVFTNGSETPHVSPFPLPVAAQPAAKWLCENLMPNTEGHNIGMALALAILEHKES